MLSESSKARPQKLPLSRRLPWRATNTIDTTRVLRSSGPEATGRTRTPHRRKSSVVSKVVTSARHAESHSGLTSNSDKSGQQTHSRKDGTRQSASQSSSLPKATLSGPRPPHPYHYTLYRPYAYRTRSQISISPLCSGPPELLSPTGTSKLDISIECRTRKECHELSAGTASSHERRDPEVLTSNNVVVALTITEDQDTITRSGVGVGLGGNKGEATLPSVPPRLDRVASITIETGHSDEQNKTAVEISFRPDLFTNVMGFSPECEPSAVPKS